MDAPTALRPYRWSVQTLLRRLRLPGWLGPALLSGGLLAAGEVEVWTGTSLGGIGVARSTPRLALAVSVAVVTTALAFRRQRPLAVSAFVCVILAVQVSIVTPQVSLVAGLFPVLITVYNAAAYGPRPWRVAGLAAGLALQGTFSLNIAEERVTGEILFALFVIVGAWFVGDIERTRQHRSQDVIEELHRVEADLDARMALALADERAAIARELHDVIAHGVSVMGVQAAGAQVLVDRDPPAAKAAMRAIEAQARESVEELQRLLGVLRDSSDPAGLEPQPGLHQVPALITQMCQAGVSVELSVRGAERSLPAGVDLAAYRVVQEALTNVLKHAGRVAARVQLSYEAGSLGIDIRDAGRSPSTPGRPGHGLIGMRERITLYGGSVDVSQPPDGGFRVSVRIPLQPVPA